MSGSLGTLTLDLIAKIGGFTGPLDQAGRSARKSSKEMVDAAKEASAAWSALAGAAAGVVGAFSVASIFGRFLTETRNAEQEQAQLGAVLRSTGESAGFNRDQLNEMAGALEKATTFSGGDINQAQTTLLAFTGVVGNQFNRALQSAADMATRTGSTVKDAAETIGRALDVPSQGLTALSKQGFRFTEEQKKMALAMESTGNVAGAQGIILQALEESYGGAAAAARDTFGGAMDALQNTISGLLTGEGSLEGARQAVEALNEALASPAAKVAVEALGTAAALLAAVLTTRLVASVVSTSSSFLLLQVQAGGASLAAARLTGATALATTGIVAMGVAARAAAAAVALLGGPAGIAIAAAGALAYFMTRSDDTKESVDSLAGSVDLLNKSFEGLTVSQAKVEIKAYTQELIDAQLEAIDLREAIDLYHRKLAEQPDSSKQRELNDALDEAQAKLDSTSSRIDVLSGKLRELSGIAAGVPDLTESKTYKEMAKKIEEQILLAGKRTEADKLEARIKAGLVEGLKAGEGERLVAAQRRADAETKAAAATKKAEEDAKSRAKSAAEALKKRGVDAEEGYRRQIALIDETTGKQGKATEVAKLAFELETGKLKGVSSERRKVLEGLAAELDAKVKLQKQNQEDLKLATYAANLKDSNTVVRQGFELEIAGAGQSDKLRDRLRENLAIEQDFVRQRNELYKQYKEAELLGDPDAKSRYDKETALLDDALTERMAIQQDYYAKQDEAQLKWLDGVSSAWGNYLDQSRDISGQTKTLFTDAFSGMNDALYGFVTTGKLSLGDLATTFAQSALRMLIQWGTAQVTMAALNAFTSTAAIPIVGPLAAPAAAASALGTAGSFMSTISSVAGMAHDGIDAIPETGTWLLQKGERVTTAQTSAKLDRTLDDVRSRRGGGGTVVNIIGDRNKAGAVERRTTPDGQEHADVFVADVWGGGERAQALEQIYGLTRRGS
ncbi:phage tail tape measure protein [Pseudomonas qingdaonensis]|uniref:phage tail tape measure protein n=1 Tax=Pseudomonas qingdaonensis TaxID=2056231 RepID=UPI00242C6057|nr:phage tail tape measure protein [Pseudomonas qingdaonensis]